MEPRPFRKFLLRQPGCRPQLTHLTSKGQGDALRRAIQCHAGDRDRKMPMSRQTVSSIGEVSTDKLEQGGLRASDRRVSPDRLIALHELADRAGHDAAQAGLPLHTYVFIRAEAIKVAAANPLPHSVFEACMAFIRGSHVGPRDNHPGNEPAVLDTQGPPLAPRAWSGQSSHPLRRQAVQERDHGSN